MLKKLGGSTSERERTTGEFERNDCHCTLQNRTREKIAEDNERGYGHGLKKENKLHNMQRLPQRDVSSRGGRRYFPFWPHPPPAQLLLTVVDSVQFGTILALKEGLDMTAPKSVKNTPNTPREELNNSAHHQSMQRVHGRHPPRHFTGSPT